MKSLVDKNKFEEAANVYSQIRLRGNPAKQGYTTVYGKC
jgi:hypothetical protein